jgi:hypothetical protein
MDRIERRYGLPTSLLAQLDQDIGTFIHGKDNIIAAAIAAFLRLSPDEQRSALEAVAILFPPRAPRKPRQPSPPRPYQPHPRVKRADAGLAVRQRFKNPDRLIG